MQPESRRILLQAFLFIATFVTTTFAGSEWSYGRSVFFTPDYSWTDFLNGMQYSVPLLLILTVHEFGHYFTAMYHKVKSSLPYYIPFPPGLPYSIGTMGAVIRLRSAPRSNIEHFDIGLAGPLAGFVVTLIVMIYGFATLPPVEYIFQFHPEYEQYGAAYAQHVYEPLYLEQHKQIVDVRIGKNLLFLLFEQFVSDPSRIPNSHELMHYPVLLAAYIALFFTSLNLLPIGQLDGGHVVYGLFGFKTHKVIALVFFLGLMFYSGLGLDYLQPTLPKNELLVAIPLYVLFLYFALSGLRLGARNTWMIALLLFALQFILAHFFKGIEGYSGWLFFAFLLGRVIGVYHPPSEIEQPLNPRRVVLGWVALLIFVVSFSPAPIVIQVIGQP